MSRERRPPLRLSAILCVSLRCFLRDASVSGQDEFQSGAGSIAE